MLELTGRGERIRTSDLMVPNDRRGKNVSYCLFESCSHQEISSVLHSFPFHSIRYRLCAENSVHKLATEILDVGFCRLTQRVMKRHANAFSVAHPLPQFDDFECYFLKSAIQFTMTLIC
jgi:hypothetical protein